MALAHSCPFTPIKFDQNFKNRNLGIYGYIGDTMTGDESSKDGKKQKRWCKGQSAKPSIRNNKTRKHLE